MNSKDNFRPSRKFSHKGTIRPSSIVESHGPSGKLRGTAVQLVDRYVSLGRDALREGDGVLAEAFFQHAEHYRRAVASYAARRPAPKSTPEAASDEEGGSEMQGELYVEDLTEGGEEEDKLSAL